MGSTANDPTAQAQKIWIHPQLIDDIHDVWRGACRLADTAYRSWSQAAGASRAAAYAVYAAHLDQEEAAARHLRSSIETPCAEPETWPCAPPAGPPTESGGAERSEAIRCAFCVAPLWDAQWARLLTIAARPRQGGQSTPRPRPGDPPRQGSS